jgi:FkbM family methyltransferase
VSSSIDTNQCSDLLRQLIAENRAALKILDKIAEDARHTHHLQHGVIQEIRNTILDKEYRALGPEKIIEFTYDEIPIKLYLPTGVSDLIQQSILQYRSFFHYDSLEMTRRYIPMRGDVVVDIGAYIGNHTVYYSKICGAAKIHSFEPIASSFRSLAKNVEINQVDATLHNCGLGSEVQRARSEINLRNVGGSRLVFDEEGPIIIKPLDTLELPPFSFMKIDVEGMGPEVLLGAQKTIARYQPKIVIEAFPHEFERINLILEGLGYTKQARVADDFVYFPRSAAPGKALFKGCKETVSEGQRILRERDAAIAERDDLVRQRDVIASEREQIARERDAAIVERDDLVRQRDVIASEREQIARERDAAIVERDDLARRRDELTQEGRRWFEAATQGSNGIGLPGVRGSGALVWRAILQTGRRRKTIAAGRHAAKSRKWEIAVRHYCEAVHCAPRNSALWVQYGHALKEAGKLDEAEWAYRRALECNGRIADTHLQLGYLLASQNRTTEASESFVRALQLDDQLQYARYALLALGWKPEAIDRRRVKPIQNKHHAS